MNRLIKFMFMIVLFFFLCSCSNVNEKKFNLVKTTIDGNEYGTSIINGYIAFSNNEMSDGTIYITYNNELFIDWIISDGTFTNQTTKSDTYKEAIYTCKVTSADDKSQNGVLVGIYQKIGKDNYVTEAFGLGVIDSNPNTYFNFAKLPD